jgi:hypothetical protein
LIYRRDDIFDYAILNITKYLMPILLLTPGGFIAIILPVICGVVDAYYQSTKYPCRFKYILAMIEFFARARNVLIPLGLAFTLGAWGI